MNKIDINKNSHTTSTKCQYHIANSKPKWCFILKCPFHNLIKQINKKKVHTNTWNPWNPVAIKNVRIIVLSVPWPTLQTLNL